ncbi:hypothetical protein [Actinocorallia libanotica]|uniref:Uncharacterized protein n=1 Tax=Actinocorallia libanotica TaxID=46162 RepID=A0ABN1RZK6_9ACTN
MMGYVEYEGRWGLFISQKALALAAIAGIALGMGALVKLVPGLAVPASVTAAVATLLFGVWTWTQHTSTDTDKEDRP